MAENQQPKNEECCKTLKEVEDDIIRALLKIIPVNATHLLTDKQDENDTGFIQLREEIRQAVNKYLTNKK